MKKNYFILVFFILLMALAIVSCSTEKVDDTIPQDKSEEVVVEKTNKKIIKTMHAIGYRFFSHFSSPVSVCYVMYEDSTVGVFNKNGEHVKPYSLEEAKAIMLTEMNN